MLSILGTGGRRYDRGVKMTDVLTQKAGGEAVVFDRVKINKFCNRALPMLSY